MDHVVSFWTSRPWGRHSGSDVRLCQAHLTYLAGLWSLPWHRLRAACAEVQVKIDDVAQEFLATSAPDAIYMGRSFPHCHNARPSFLVTPKNIITFTLVDMRIVVFTS